MSDTKLREKADALIAFTQLGPRFIAWVEAVTDALAPAPEKAAKVETMADRIAADLKAGTFRGEQPAPPAPEKAAKVCGNCGEKVSSLSDHVTCAETGDYYCQPAPPAPAAPVIVMEYGKCGNCGEKIGGTWDHYAAGSFTCQKPKPAPPEPAAREMPEAVRDAVDTLRSGVPSYPTWRQYADTLESWWRNLAQPVAVGMTEELEHVLSIAERDLRYKEECFDDSARTVHDERIERLRAAIAAVRQQAAQGRKVELGKVRELIEWEVKNNGSGLWAAALAELDAAEGKERE